MSLKLIKGNLLTYLLTYLRGPYTKHKHKKNTEHMQTAETAKQKHEQTRAHTTHIQKINIHKNV